jgi:hypothetical protein
MLYPHPYPLNPYPQPVWVTRTRAIHRLPPMSGLLPRPSPLPSPASASLPATPRSQGTPHHCCKVRLKANHNYEFHGRVLVNIDVDEIEVTCLDNKLVCPINGCPGLYPRCLNFLRHMQDKHHDMVDRNSRAKQKPQTESLENELQEKKKDGCDLPQPLGNTGTFCQSLITISYASPGNLVQTLFNEMKTDLQTVIEVVF